MRTSHRALRSGPPCTIIGSDFLPAKHALRAQIVCAARLSVGCASPAHQVRSVRDVDLGHLFAGGAPVEATFVLVAPDQIRLAGSLNAQAVFRINVDSKIVRSRQIRRVHVVDLDRHQQHRVVCHQVGLRWTAGRQSLEQRRGFGRISRPIVAHCPGEFFEQRFVARGEPRQGLGWRIRRVKGKS